MRLARVALLGAAAVVLGCGGDEEDSIPLVRVKGTITRNGDPLADARVSFMPESGNKYSTPGIDQTGPDGNYLIRFKGRTGIAAGTYKVIVTPPIELPSGFKMPEEFKDDPLMGQMAAGIDPNATRTGSKKAKPIPEAEFPDVVVEEKDVSRTLDFDMKEAKAKAETKKPAH